MDECEGADTADEQEQHAPAPGVASAWWTRAVGSAQRQQGRHPPHREERQEGKQEHHPHTSTETPQQRRPGNGQWHRDGQEIVQQAGEVGLHGEATRATYHGTNGSKDGSLEHIHRQGLRCAGS